ncbi:MAG: hypothetical protein WCW02_04355 [Candidatus Buchananbacteria bacterium]
MIKSGQSFLALLFLIAVLTVGCTKTVDNVFGSVNLSPTKPVVVDLVKLKSDYEQKLNSILANLAVDDLSRLNQTKEQVLALKVPPEYKDLHLGLVLALDKMLNGFKQPATNDLRQGLNELAALKQRYSWLNSF